MTSKAVEVLKDLEWIGRALGQGAYMGDDRGNLYPSCPVCGGLKRGAGAEYNGEFKPSAFGHLKNCKLVEAIHEAG